MSLLDKVNEKLYASEPPKKKRVREAAEADLVTFINLVAPYRVLGSVHKEMASWWQRSDRKDHQLTLLPRDHGKSAMIAYRAAHRLITRPDSRILYISSTANLAEKQLKAIKDILTSDKVQYYWPHHVNADIMKRAKWTNTEIELDHPIRKEEGIRDPSVFTGGLTTSLTGLHCDIAILDDVVVMENAYTDEGRNKVASQYSLLSSIEGGDAEEWVVGTRYHPKDLYSEMLAMMEEIYDEAGDVVDAVPVYEVFERAVENRGDGTGEFLWPRQQRSDGKWFGFNREILSKKRGKYLDRTQFYAQYYNNPNSPEDEGINRDNFQYYDKKYLTRRGGIWYNKDVPLNIYASIDFAYSTKKAADYTVIAVVGIDPKGMIYILDLDRFKTEKISEYFEHIVQMYTKWEFRKLRCEVTSGQKAIVRELKDQYLRPNGLALAIEESNPTRHQGSKIERINAILEPRYTNLSIWHYQGGNCQILEDELVLKHPPHDDVKDAVASAVEIAVPPVSRATRGRSTVTQINTHPRFGGVSF